MLFRRLIHLAVCAGLCGTASLAPAQKIEPDPSQEGVENPKPTWETQKQARTYQLQIPAPRGQITDRHGNPLAQTRVSYNLAISFPTPLNMTDQQVIDFARQQVTLAKALLKRDIPLNEQAVLRHYHNRGVLPFDILEDLEPRDLQAVGSGLSPNLVLRQTYVRIYPGGTLAAHILGYTGREAPLSLRPIENFDLLFPESEGREGIEQAFNEQLTGQKGLLNLTFDAEGRKTSERIARQPVPGYNVITTLDENIQRICEDVLSKNCKRGAVVILDPQSGEILAMASWPTFNPNSFVPVVRPEVFNKLQNDPAAPLLSRAFRASYPPGSTFKTFVGLAALESGTITPKSRFSCPPSFSLGKLVFNNWKKTHAGELNFAEALAQSCNTWFYQVGLKTGAKNIIEWAHRLGFGRRTGIPLRAEATGNIPTDEYMLRVHKRRILNGDTVNMSIGQGDILITPLQMAQAMGVIASGGNFHQTRLVKQVQTIDNKVVAAYPDRTRDFIPMSPDIITEMRKALVMVTEHGTGTAHSAKVKGIKVAGKTGTAQWGPKDRQRTAAWFAGFAPAENPRYAFAVVYESDPGVKAGGGSHAAPIIGKILRELFAEPKGGKGKQQSEPEQPAAAEQEPAPSPEEEAMPEEVNVDISG